MASSQSKSSHLKDFWNLVDSQLNIRSPAITSSLSPSSSSKVPTNTPSTTPQPQRKNNTKRTKLNDRFTPSVLRPNDGRARDRFSTWLTPFAIRRKQKMREQGIAPEDANKMFSVMIHSLEDTTRDSYASALLRFTQFCDKRNIPEDDRMPASEDLLTLFTTSCAGNVSQSTITTWLAGLKFWHTIHGAKWHGEDSGLLARARIGVRKLAPISSRRAKRPPVTIEHMETLYDNLDHNNPKDIATWAVASIAFWSCCRLGELILANLFNPDHHVTRGAELKFSYTRSSPGTPPTEYATLFIPWSKTTERTGATISITARKGDRLCPVAALKRHVSLNFDVPDSAPFFAYNDNNVQGWSPLKRDAKGGFMERCNQIWVAEGLPEMPGHSFRIGGATHLLLLGHHPDMVATQGRWKSRAFLEYWREIDSILPLFLSTHNPNVTHDSIRDSIKSYAKVVKHTPKKR